MISDALIILCDRTRLMMVNNNIIYAKFVEYYIYRYYCYVCFIYLFIFIFWLSIKSVHAAKKIVQVFSVYGCIEYIVIYNHVVLVFYNIYIDRLADVERITLGLFS